MTLIPLIYMRDTQENSKSLKWPKPSTENNLKLKTKERSWRWGESVMGDYQQGTVNRVRLVHILRYLRSPTITASRV